MILVECHCYKWSHFSCSYTVANFAVILSQQNVVVVNRGLILVVLYGCKFCCHIILVECCCCQQRVNSSCFYAASNYFCSHIILVECCCHQQRINSSCFYTVANFAVILSQQNVIVNRGLILVVFIRLQILLSYYLSRMSLLSTEG